MQSLDAFIQDCESRYPVLAVQDDVKRIHTASWEVPLPELLHFRDFLPKQDSERHCHHARGEAVTCEGPADLQPYDYSRILVFSVVWTGPFLARSGRSEG
jgi:hypothetical protein